MNFAIIAAGDGSRLKNEGVTVQKPLVKINGSPMIYTIINSAINSGATSISIIINEYSIELKEYLNSLNFSIPINIVQKTTPSSMHSLFELAGYLDRHPFFLVTADTVYREDEFLNYVDYCKANTCFDAILAVTEFVDDEKPLSVKLDANNKILRFEDSIGNNQFITGGLYYFRSDIFSEMEYALENKITRLRNFLRLLLDKEHQIYAFPFSKMIDVDHAEDIKKAEAFLTSANNNIIEK